MQNPFITTFSKNPETSYIYIEKTNEILSNFSYENPSESVYKITGVRGSGKTVILAKIEEELRKEEMSKKGWFVFDINPTRDLLNQVASMLVEEGFGKNRSKSKSFNVSASVLGTGAGIGISSDDAFFDIGVEIEAMLKQVQKRIRKYLSELMKFPKQKK